MIKISLKIIFSLIISAWLYSGAMAYDICRGGSFNTFTIVNSGSCSGGTSKIWVINWVSDYISFNGSIANNYTNGNAYFEEPFGDWNNIKLYVVSSQIKTYWNWVLTDSNTLGDISEFNIPPAWTIYNAPPPAPVVSQNITTSGAYLSWGSGAYTTLNRSWTAVSHNSFLALSLLPYYILAGAVFFILGKALGIFKFGSGN